MKKLLIVLLLTIMISCAPKLEPGKYDFYVDDVRIQIVDSDNIHMKADLICIYFEDTTYPQYTCFERERVVLEPNTSP